MGGNWNIAETFFELQRGHTLKFTEVKGLIKIITAHTIYLNKHKSNYDSLNTVNIYNQAKTFGSPCIF